MKRKIPIKKIADAAGGLESAKERHQKYHTPQSYINNPMLSSFFHKQYHRNVKPIGRNQR